MFEKTTKVEVIAEAAIWALPRTKWEIERSEDGCPFEYELKTNTPYQDGAIKLHEVELKVILPEGIPLLEKAVETLKDAIYTEQRDSMQRVEVLQQQIDTLALLEHLPEDEPDDFDESMDGDHDTAMASAGMGTDEDYGGGDGMERL